ncbi:cell wall metabolism sensor histidine kinase WalK [Pedobacter sp. SYSU D00535]|uniref:sensor histidine kinase n=1 Tax=Pedobacter sp. SYSU D00535 TaxID=2810308 RepID=UPI001A95BDD9|nr:HAMP domain-containing sensor histidine kinase [Pedobacter sp. SYSU D00535]
MILQLISGLSESSERMHAASKLAEYLGGSSLMIFIRDPEINILLPAPGFQQTIPDGNKWHCFLNDTAKQEIHKGTLPFPDNTSSLPALGIAGPSQSVAVLLGRIPEEAQLTELREILPVLISLFKKEQELLSARIRIELAEKTAVKAEKLANTIDLMRANLNDALVKQEKDRKDIEELMRKKDEFMNVASHELKTPLTSMKAFLQMLQRTVTKGDNAHAIRFIERANAQVDRLTALVNDLLDVSKIQAGQMVYNFSEVAIAEVINEVVSQIQVGVSTHKIIAENNVHAIIKCDRSRLEQVIGNFLSNAVKYSPDADEVVVTCSLVDGNVRVTVEDFGIGIPEEMQAFVFDRFYRVHSSSQKFPGLGIGLYISAEIIKRHGGHVGVDSDEESTRFYFEIPVVG